MIDPISSTSHPQDVADLLGGAFAGHTMQRLRTPDGKYRYSYVSAGLKASFGLDPVELMQLEEVDHRWLHPEDRPRFIAALERSAAELTRLDEEVRVIHASGGYKWVRSIGNPRRLADGTVIWDGVALDVTDRREARDALERTLLQVKQNEASEGRFSYIAARDVMDRLADLRGAIDALGDADGVATAVRTSFVEFERALMAARDLVERSSAETDSVAQQERAGAHAVALTRRQSEILDHVGRGQTNREIADGMGISEGTVKLHVSAVLKRLGLNNRTEAAAWLRDRGRA